MGQRKPNKCQTHFSIHFQKDVEIQNVNARKLWHPVSEYVRSAFFFLQINFLNISFAICD